MNCGAVFAPLLLALMFNSAALVVILWQAGSLLYRRDGQALASIRSLPHVSTAIVVVVLLHIAISAAELSQAIKARAHGQPD